MAHLKPFRALRYDAGTAGPLDDLVAPPHDVITPESERRLLAESPFNSVRLVRPEEPAEAARLLTDWCERGVLVREERPAVWILEESFAGGDGRQRRRRGIVARVRVEPYEAGVILPHERTFSRQKSHRLELLRATRAKLSPILLLHDGTAPEPAGDPQLAAELDGVTSRLWAVEDPEAIELILGQVGERLVIADGHHRYETALRFHEEEGSPETAYVLVAVVSRYDEGLDIQPTHRVTSGAVPALDGGLRRTALGDPVEAVTALGALPRDHAAFVLLERSGVTLVEADSPNLDTAIVDALPLEDVGYTASAAEAERAVAEGSATAAFLVRPPTVDQVEAFALAGELMPPKSTYFSPKLTSGLLFSPFDE
jgi:uncharacterized protein (DUF1015 family)